MSRFRSAPLIAASLTSLCLIGTVRAEDQVEVKIADFAFAPATLTVTAGTTVTWINQDKQRHTVVFSDQASSMLAQGGRYQRSFKSAGEFSYKCGRHENMVGKIVVTKP